MSQGWLVSAVFGRDEDGSVMELRQRDVDELTTILLKILDGQLLLPLQTHMSKIVLDVR